MKTLLAYVNWKTRILVTVLLLVLPAAFIPARAQSSSVSLRLIPELTLNAPLGSTNILQGAWTLNGTNAWSNLFTLVFTNTTMTLVDQRITAAPCQFYRLQGTAPNTNLGGVNPPFAAPLSNLVWMASGSFVMGSQDSDLDRVDDEQPATPVTLTKGFFIGKYEVTQGEFVAVVGSNPSTFPGDDQLPVDNVSWADAADYCSKLSQREQKAGRLPTGWTYRLPTEAEWEYSARAGSTNRFSYGEDPGFALLGGYAWYSANGNAATHRVGLKTPNARGLYDMAGNVCEWCLDSYSLYSGAPSEDPIGAGSGNNKVFRGGSFQDTAVAARSASRRSIDSSIRLSSFGFRVVLAYQP